MIQKNIFILIILALFLTTGCMDSSSDYDITGRWEIDITTKEGNLIKVTRTFSGNRRTGVLYPSASQNPIGNYKIDNLGIVFSTNWNDEDLNISITNSYQGQFTSPDTMMGTLNQKYIDKTISASWKGRRLN